MNITRENIKRLELLAEIMNKSETEILNQLIEQNYKTLMGDALLNEAISLDDKDAGVRVSEDFHNEIHRIKEKSGLPMYKIILLLLKRIELRPDINESTNNYCYGKRCKIIRTSTTLIDPIKKMAKEREYKCMGVMLEHAFKKGLFDIYINKWIVMLYALLSFIFLEHTNFPPQQYIKYERR